MIVRRLRVFALDPMEADFPFVRTLLIIDKEVTQKKSGKVHTETHYAISSAQIDQYSPAQWCGLYLGHWRGVEIRNHWIRDVYWGEDKSRTRHVNILANLALLRNALLALLPDHFPDQCFPVIQETLRINPARCLKILSS